MDIGYPRYLVDEFQKGTQYIVCPFKIANHMRKVKLQKPQPARFSSFSRPYRRQIFAKNSSTASSAKFITAIFRNPQIKEAVTDLLENRDGLMLGICNGFQALIKLGLVPYGKIIDTDETCPTLTFNNIARHQSRIVRTRVASNKSPWLALTNVGDVYNVAISHGEGKFLASEELIRQLAANGQIATQYVDLEGAATSDIHFNPNGSMYAIEGITSPDGRVFGKMGHSERIGAGLYRNVPGNYDIQMFKAAVEYFK